MQVILRSQNRNKAI